jgi:hypothetical protein
MTTSRAQEQPDADRDALRRGKENLPHERGGVGDTSDTVHAVPQLEVWGPQNRNVVALDDERIVLGKDPHSTIALEWDTAVSRAHAVVEHVGAAWVINDLTSRNGTFVNGERIFAPRVMHHGDEIRLGRTRIIFHDAASRGGSTAPTRPSPELTRGEHKVLVELCRPLLSPGVFREPATVRDIAKRRFVTEAAVKQHLAGLYNKFEIDDNPELPNRRVRLANAALESGAVRLSDLGDSED